jgi:uncharacterized membrane protein
MCLVSAWLFFLGDSTLPSTGQYLTDIIAIYAPFITPIFAFWFSEDVFSRNTTGGNAKQETVPSVVAIITSGFFNFVIICILESAYFAREGEAVVEQAIKGMSIAATVLTIIVGPAIGYFFSRGGRP